MQALDSEKSKFEIHAGIEKSCLCPEFNTKLGKILMLINDEDGKWFEITEKNLKNYYSKKIN